MDTTPSYRRRAAALCAFAVVALAGTAGTATAAPLRPPPSGPGTPVGVWQAVVMRPGETHGVTFTFTPGGKACLDISGVRAGTGTWTSTGGNRFRYQVRELFVEDDGSVVGYVDIDQSAARAGARYASSGQSAVHAPDGTFLESVRARVVATRTSGTTEGC